MQEGREGICSRQVVLHHLSHLFDYNLHEGNDGSTSFIVRATALSIANEGMVVKMNIRFYLSSSQKGYKILKTLGEG